MLRVIASVNWVLGVLALVAAVVYPPIIETLSKSYYAVAEDTVKSLARAETLYLTLNNSYYTFDATEQSNQKAFRELELTQPAAEDGLLIFLYSATAKAGGGLEIVARTNPDLVFKQGYQPKVFIHRIGPEGEGSGSWQPLSNVKRGLGLF